MINVQNRKNGHRNSFTTQNERYQDFLRFALNRIIETALYYESQAKMSHHPGNKLFLYFLAGKKRVQHVILEIVATNKNNSTSSTTDYSSISNNTTEDVPLADAKPEFIIKYAHERAEKDLNLYTSLAALEEDIHTKKLLLTLSKMSRDFIQDVTIGYSKFASTQLHSSFMNIPTNINSIVKRKEETPVR
jgi:hypothetical protein